MLIKDVMTSPAITVREDTALREVAAMLVAHRVSGLPVVDSTGALVGVISEADIVRNERGKSTGERFARDAMSAPVWTIEPHRLVAEAARLMLDHGVNRLPVLSGDELIGIVTRADLVRAFVRPDIEIAEEIRGNAALLAHGLDPNGLVIRVRDGEVKIGPVPSPDDSELVEHVVQAVPGVVSADSRPA